MVRYASGPFAPFPLTLILSLREMEQRASHSESRKVWIVLRGEQGSPSPQGRYLFTVAQIFNLPYRRFIIGGTLLAGDSWQVKNLRHSAARRSRNPIVIVLLLVLVLDRPVSDDENEDDDEDERFTRAATISGDTDRLQVCATGAVSTLNTYQGRGPPACRVGCGAGRE